MRRFASIIRNGADPASLKGSAETVTLSLDDALQEVGHGSFQRILLVICGLVLTSDAVEIMMLSFLQECLTDWDLSQVQIAAVTTAVFAGELVGALLWGILGDRIGRRYAFLGAALTLSVFGLLTAAAPNYTALIILRFLVGIGVGGIPIPFDLLAEYLQPEVRGRYLTLIGYFWSAGSLYCVFVAWLLLDSTSWRVMVIACALPPICAVGCFFVLPESPRWLVVRGRYTEAEELLSRAAAVNGRLLEVKLIKTPCHNPPTAKDLISEPHRKSLILFSIIYLSWGFVYYCLILVLPRLLNDTDEDTCDNFDYSSLLWSCFVEALGVFVVLQMIDPLGRKVSTWSMYSACAVFMCILLMSDDHTFVAVFSALARATVMGGTSATCVHTPESFPTFIRATAHGLTNAAARVGGMLAPFVADGASVNTSLAILVVVNVVASVCAYLLPLETSKMVLVDASDDDTAPGSSSNGVAGTKSTKKTKTTGTLAELRPALLADTPDRSDNP